MDYRVILRLDPREDGPVSWVRLTDKGGVVGQVRQASLEDAAKELAGQRVLVLVPGTDVTLLRAKIPTRSRQQMVKAAPYAVEEQLAADIDDTHFALGNDRAADGIPVAAVSRERMQRWDLRLSEAGIDAAMIIPETLAVPAAEDGWSILVDGSTALVRTSRQGGFAVDTENAQFVMQRALEEEEEQRRPARIRIVAKEVAGAAPGEVLDLALPEIDVERTASREDPLLQLANGLDERSAINLLQGSFSHRPSPMVQWRPWLPAIALLVIWAAVEIGAKAVDYFQLEARNAALTEEINRTYRQAFPDARRIVNPRLQMERALASMRGQSNHDGDFLRLLAGSGQILQRTKDVSLRGLSYRSGALLLEIEASDLQILDRLKNDINQQPGLDAEIQSASSVDNQVQSRLRIRSLNP